MDGASLARFRKLCGLLGSNHDGERAAAAAKATEFLKREGLTWQSVGVNGSGSTDLSFEQMEQMRSWGQAARQSADVAKHLREENARLQREVDRLKGMWSKGEPAREDDGMQATADKALRRKIAAACEACARGDATMSNKVLKLFRDLMFKERWTAEDRAMVERALKWVKYDLTGEIS